MNSIKTARRVDGLLRALGFNCRTIHAQLQQRQRLRALESYRESANSILVATDVAARGLDIPQINSVLHYDVARSPQVLTDVVGVVVVTSFHIINSMLASCYFDHFSY